MIREVIKKEMKHRGDRPAKLAREIGVNTAPLYNYLNGKSGLGYKVLETICEYYDLVLIKKF